MEITANLTAPVTLKNTSKQAGMRAFKLINIQLHFKGTTTASIRFSMLALLMCVM